MQCEGYGDGGAGAAERGVEDVAGYWGFGGGGCHCLWAVGGRVGGQLVGEGVDAFSCLRGA